MKILADQQSDESAFYFHREARAIASLSHANIVPIHDYSGPNERPAFLVMQLVHGQNLEEALLGHHPLPEAVVLSAVRQIAAGLAHAHSKGVIHRDLKPANCMLETSGRVFLTDFGLAKAYEDESLLGETVAGRLTKLFGTPDFLAPEQITREELGPHTDIFALGTLMHYLSAARLPFAADDLLQTMRRITAVDFDSLGDIRPDFSSETLQLVEDCFHPEPSRRPSAERVASVCAELLGDLEAADPELVLKRFIEDLDAEDTRVDPVSSNSTVQDVADFTAPASPAPQHTMPVPKHTAKDSSVGRWAPRANTQPTELTIVSGLGSDIKRPVPELDAPPRPRSVTWLAIAGLLTAGVAMALGWFHFAQESSAGAATAVTSATALETERASSTAPPKAPPEQSSAASPSPAPSQPSGTSVPDFVANKPSQPSPVLHAISSSPANEHKARPRPQRERQAKPGRVRFVVVPWGTIRVDGKERGNTPLLTELTLPAGRHVIEISHPSYGKQKRVLHVAPGSSSTVNVNFSP